jgi:signal transduction histidine kinase
MENMQLLLVDDEVSYITTIAKRLEKRGIVPDVVTSARECLAIMEEKPVDVVVSDVKMPGMDGIELLHQIKNHHAETEVILLTGHASSSDGVEGIKTGAFDYLQKPVEFEQLFRKIRQAFNKIQRLKELKREADFRLRMEQQMIAAERLASIGTLASGVAHEINNPLAIINESVGYLQMLLKREALSDMPCKKDFEMALEKIEKAIQRARRITHQLLGTVRKHDAMISVEINIGELVEESFDLVRQEASGKMIELVHQEDSSGFKLWCDPYPLRQVLINLLTNAIHASGKHGKIEVMAQEKEEYIQLIIRDNGMGIPPENLDKVFEPFFTTKKPGEGTGLGLFVTRGIIEKLGGKIRINSRLGKGTEVCLELPRRQCCYKPADKSHNEKAGVLKRIGKRFSREREINQS